MITLKSKEKERIRWVDIVRGIGIFLVIMAHTYRDNSVLIWITSFHMPLFFILSGWLRGSETKRFDWKKFILKKAQSLLVPLVIFELMTYVYWFVIESHFREFDFGPMWFLVALFIAEVVSESFLYFNSNMIVASIICCVGLYFSPFLTETAVSLGGWIPRCLGATMFYLVGMVIAQYKAIGNVAFYRHKISVVTLALGSIILSQINGRVDLYFLMFKNYFIYVLASVVGSIFVYGAAQLIAQNRFIEHIGRYSIVILCTHEPIKRIIIQVVGIVTQVNSEELRNNVLIGLGIAIVVLLIELIIIEIVKYIANILKNTRFKWLVAFVK